MEQRDTSTHTTTGTTTGTSTDSGTTTATGTSTVDPHRLPEGPLEWRLDELSRQRGRAGIALARETLRAALERRARLQAAPGRSAEGADGLELVA